MYSRVKLFARLDTISTIWMMKPDKITSVTRKHQYRFTRNRSSRVEKRRNHPPFVTSTFIIRSMASFLPCIPLEIWRERITKKRQCDMTTDCVRENGYYEANIYRLVALKNSARFRINRKNEFPPCFTDYVILWSGYFLLMSLYSNLQKSEKIMLSRLWKRSRLNTRVWVKT